MLGTIQPCCTHTEQRARSTSSNAELRTNSCSRKRLRTTTHAAASPPIMVNACTGKVHRGNQVEHYERGKAATG